MPKLTVSQVEAASFLQAIAEGMISGALKEGAEVDDAVEEARTLKWLLHNGVEPQRAEWLSKVDVTMDLVFASQDKQAGYLAADIAPEPTRMQ